VSFSSFLKLMGTTVSRCVQAVPFHADGRRRQRKLVHRTLFLSAALSIVG